MSDADRLDAIENVCRASAYVSSPTALELIAAAREALVLRAAVARLTATLAEVRDTQSQHADTRRIDWMAQQDLAGLQFATLPGPLFKGLCEVRWRRKVRPRRLSSVYGQTFRAALDAAIQRDEQEAAT